MSYDIETIYYLANPETDQFAFATGSQLRYEDIIKEIFGVASIHDLPMMIQYNKSFQTSICKYFGVLENEINLEMIVRVATKMDLLQLKKQSEEQRQQMDEDGEHNISCPFDSVIRLQEGIFQWDDEHSSYNLVKTT